MVNMKRIIFIIVIIIVGSLLYILYNSNHVANNNNFDESTNSIIKDLVSKTIKIQYGKIKNVGLNNVFTLELQNRIIQEPSFYKEGSFYFIDKSYMQTLSLLNDGNLTVSVNIEDSKGSYIQILTFTRENGVYLVSDMSFDI